MVRNLKRTNVVLHQEIADVVNKLVEFPMVYYLLLMLI